METEEEKFNQAYNECAGEDVKDIDVNGFIAQCEVNYEMTTTEFVHWFETNQFEGNPEQQLWYMFVKNRSQS